MSDLVHSRLRAPTADGFALIDPPLSQAAALIERNRAIGGAFDQSAGFSSEFRTAARILLLSAAAIGEGVEPDGNDLKRPIAIGGHQPELFHPGVWFKNFVLSAIAERVGGTGINLAIDNDTVQRTSIRVPDRGAAQVQVSDVLFDKSAAEVPWERRDILDLDRFRRFDKAVAQHFKPYLAEPAYRHGMLLGRVWPHAWNAAQRQQDAGREALQLSGGRRLPSSIAGSANLGQCLVAGRRGVERELGLKTRETQLSLVADDSCFVEFADRLLMRHREFHEIHNAALAEYRAVNHVRSPSRPIANLARDGEWYEAPFWLWSFSDSERRKVFVRRVDGRWQITDRQGITFTRQVSADRDDDLWIRLVEQGLQLRPRALITTMYARLVLSDLFIHGIGGAKYDEVTDLIIRRFFGVEPPAYITATTTFRLPIERPSVTFDDVRDSARRIREARFRPEAFLRDRLLTGEAAIAGRLAALAAEKREFLDKHDLRRCPPQVFARLDLLNRAMHDLLQPVERELRAEHAELLVQLKNSQLLGSREFSFVLFPSEILPARLLDLCKVSS